MPPVTLEAGVVVAAAVLVPTSNQAEVARPFGLTRAFSTAVDEVMSEASLLDTDGVPTAINVKVGVLAQFALISVHGKA